MLFFFLLGCCLIDLYFIYLFAHVESIHILFGTCIFDGSYCCFIEVFFISPDIPVYSKHRLCITCISHSSYCCLIEVFFMLPYVHVRSIHRLFRTYIPVAAIISREYFYFTCFSFVNPCSS